MRGSAEGKNHNLRFYLSYLSLILFIKRCFSLSCIGVQVVLNYKICLLKTIGIWGAAILLFKIIFDFSLFSGLGKLSFVDGSYYEGTFHNGEIEGFGTRYFASTKCKYQGQFSKGELQGKGRMIWPDGSIYEGQWEKNRREGKSYRSLVCDHF